MIIRALRTLVAATLLFSAASTAASAQSLPSSWASRDVGTVGATGTASGSGSSMTVAGAGADVWGTGDAFHFAYTQLTGDGSIVSQVSTLETVNAWTKAGVMMRDSLAANARHAFMLVSPGKGLAFQRRPTTGGTTVHTAAGGGVAPAWVKLTRAGTTFTAYRSADGATWTTVESATIPMGATIYVGVGVTSHVYGLPATATFASTRVTATPTPATSSTSGTTSTAASSTPTSSTSGATLRVLHWNTHHGGVGTDGRYDPARFASWVARMTPDLISLNEVGTSSQASALVSQITSKTGRTWYYHYDNRGNVMMSRFPITGKSICTVNTGVGRMATQISTLVNGRTINIWSAHLDASSSSVRTSEAKALVGCEQVWAEARIAAGDYNMQAGSAEYTVMTAGHTDAWTAAKALGTAQNYAGNCDGCTRNSRIDYIFTSKGAAFLALTSAQVFDTRDTRGYMPSDHKPLLVVYTVR